MGRIYRAIDSDGHVLVPLNLWEKYIEPAFRDRAPRLFIDTDGKERLRIDGNAFGGRKGLGTLGAIGARDGVVCDYNEGKKGGFDPHARIPDMDADGIDAAFFYPSIGLSLSGIADLELVHALYHAYKLWLADYCKPYPDRLFGVAMLPHKILWATDYPHPDGFFPGAPKMMLERIEGLSPQTKHGVMAGAAMGFYGLN